MAPPRKEDSDYATGSGVELDSASGGGTVTESLDVPAKPESVRVVVQAASGGFQVDIQFENTTITTTGDSTTDVDIERAVASPRVCDVVISDTSGASNTVDYDILVV